MKNKLSVFAISVLLAFSACQKQDEQMGLQGPADLKVEQSELKSAAAFKQVPQNFKAHLSGDQEVPPAATNATGQATFQLSKDGETLSYRLIVANIENVSMAHIHVAQAGVNGPVVAWLYPSAFPAQLIPGKFNGILQTGNISASNLVGPLAGKELSDLVQLMTDEGTYVNVHTSQIPGGEIRGQISSNVK